MIKLRMQKDKVKRAEVCISCKAETNVNVDTPVSFRMNYISGLGQLCRPCAERLGFNG